VDDLALSHTRFIALFRDEVGLSPKQFFRVRRLSRVIQRTRNEERPDWALLAQAYGYCDQAHLCRDFQQFVGVSPTVFMRHRHPTHHPFVMLPSVDTAAEEALTALTR
jgi:AraC-like DNA-binding protein